MNGIISTLLENEYEHIKAKMVVWSAGHGFTRQDAEDMTHDVCLVVLEELLVPKDYHKAISRVLGRWRRNRSNRLTRGV